ncbi:vitamin K-dependent gamma-carboxylase [Formosa agariphila KMM 3901]|uniref:Vitamin K-dependent gamma-carboxylase n=1 Tax=Formosa agariphila (strain DSM 15362 / KCTC 12365 / LMG 23005 / KMM 3901 / M-2Alg 35-1) TaxID=1347342 RepID=T2KIQ5_FORAG|nr:HTTM domain-containing protein [Formosa agariphila]CDF77854.1 vitamin K-dependent gamma-carboxylase [Formosa agariphila KMM 3901]
MVNKFLFKHIDNSALIVFRIIFGLLCFLETVGAIFTGWIRRVLIEPDFTFSFIGLEWLQPLPGNGMYIYYALMGLLGLFIMVGYKYRFSAISFTILWTGCYFMQKSSYNNHYYLLILLSGIMAVQPAHKYFSVDAKLHPEIQKISMPSWCSWLFIIQMLIVYTYGSINKIYPDWLDTTVMAHLMKSKANYFLVGDLLQQKTVHYFLAYGGILFDGLIIPLFLYKPTRKLAFMASIFFHLFNSFVFQVGIFPYLSLAFALFFYEPKIIHKLFFKNKKPFYDKGEVIIPEHRNLSVGVMLVYFIIQLVLPIRHHFIQDNVLWTEEGHRLSWRMMLRAKSGHATYTIKNHTQNKTEIVKLNDYLSRKQVRLASNKPDVMWQFSQRLKSVYAAKGDSISVYIRSRVSVNGKQSKPFTNPEVDIANTEWSAWKHTDWILPSK